MNPQCPAVERMKTENRPAARGRRVTARAFSLCEVAIAVGIFVFALTALLGLLPSALTSARHSLDLSTATQLADGLAAEYERTEFSALPGKETWHYFDDLGNELPGADQAVYRAKVAVTPSDSANLKMVKITVFRGTEGGSSRSFCYSIFNHR
jgi:Tfp pilus assembly protein PilV